MKYLYIGKIVNTHGIKGELRILSDFEYKDLVFKVNNKLYLGDEKEEVIINSYRHHKNYEMITINNLKNINDVLKYLKLRVYICDNEEYLNNKVLDRDFIDVELYMFNKCIGKIKRIELNGKRKLFVVNNGDHEYLIPYVSDIIESIDLKKKKIVIKDIEGLI